MQEIPMTQFERPKSVQDKAMKNGLKKIKKYWWGSIFIAIMIVPLSILGWNQYNESGICFTNLNELRIANAFVKHLDQGDYAGAFKYIGYGRIWKDAIWILKQMNICIINMNEDYDTFSYGSPI